MESQKNKTERATLVSWKDKIKATMLLIRVILRASLFAIISLPQCVVYTITKTLQARVRELKRQR